MEKNFEALLEVSSNAMRDTHENKVFVSDTEKCVMSTSGAIALFRRDMYEQVKCTLKLLGSEAATINSETLVLEKTDVATVNFNPLLDKGAINRDHTKRFRIKLPNFVSSVSKKKKHAPLYFSVSNGTPDISLVRGEYMIDVQLLNRIDLTQEYDFWFHSSDNKKPVYIFPKGTNIDNAEYFYSVLPMCRNSDEPSITAI